MVHITDVLAVAMMLGITAQVKEAGIAWDKGEKKRILEGRGLQYLEMRKWERSEVSFDSKHSGSSSE